jgi:hypothetical protein
VEWNHVGFTLQLVANSTTLPHLNPPLTKGRRLAERNFGKNGEPTPTENPEAPNYVKIYNTQGRWENDESSKAQHFIYDPGGKYGRKRFN